MAPASDPGTRPAAEPARNGHWLFVGSTGVACGAVVGWLLWMLTAAIAAAFVVGAAVASILVVLAIAGTRQNQTFRVDAAKAADARLRRQQVLDAMSDTRNPPTAQPFPTRSTTPGVQPRDENGTAGPEDGRR